MQEIILGQVIDFDQAEQKKLKNIVAYTGGVKQALKSL